jgi:hypothetical protein
MSKFPFNCVDLPQQIFLNTINKLKKLKGIIKFKKNAL